MKSCFKDLVAAFISLAGVSSLDAEVFKSSYVATQSQDYKLVTEMLVGPGVALHPSGKKIEQTHVDQIGIFSNLVAKAIPSFTNGVIISNGRITLGASLSNVYSNCSSEWLNERISDTPCADNDANEYFKSALKGRKLYDPAGLILYIQPKNKTINIPFVMASEEFYGGATTPSSPTQNKYEGYSDKFAFFLQEIGEASEAVHDPETLMTRNIAQLPKGGDVEIATINQHTNTAYFIPNVVTNEDGTLRFPAGDINLPMEFNGAIVGPVAVAEDLDTSKIYKLKLLLADFGENTCTSTIFLRENGITSGADLKVDVTGPVSIDEPGKVVFTNAVSNIGPATADGVVVTNYLPVGASYLGYDTADVGTVVDSGQGYLVWTLGDGFKSGSNAVMTVTCSLENPGTYTNRALVVTSTGDFDESNNRDECSTVVAASDTTPLEFVVDKLTKMYDGTNLLPTYSYTTNALAPGHKLTEVVFDVESIRDVGKTNVNIVGFTVKEGDTVVTEQYTPAYTAGSLEVTKRKVALTSESAEKIYDGLPLTTNEVKVTGDGFADGEGATYAVTGMQTIVGESDNAFSYEFNVGTKQGNYDVDTTCGKLKVTAIVNPIVITVQGSSKKYDGTALTDESASFTYTGGVLVDGDNLEVTLTGASITDVGTSNVMVKTYKVMHNEADVTGCYTFGDSISGVLEVTKRNVTLTSHGGEKPYDTKELTNHKDPDVGGDGFAEGEGVKEYTFTGTRTAIGTSDNTFTYALKDNTKAGNYQITLSYGKLEVTKVVTAAKIKVDNLSKTYDKTPLVATYQAEGILSGDELQVTLDVKSITTVGKTTVTVFGKKVMRGENDVTADYTFEVVPGSLEVTKRPLEITARNGQKEYGRSFAFGGKEYRITGGKLLAGDSITKVTLQSDGRVKAAVYKPEGYPITITDIKGNGLENYEITRVPGTLMIKKLPLEITATDTNKLYGTEVKFAGTEFEVTAGELVNGDTVTNVTLTSEGAAKDAAWKEGGYEIKGDYPVGGKGAGNYAITFLPGTLTVDKRKITITAGDTNKVYGTGIELDRTAFEITEGDLADGDTVTEVTLTSEGATAGAEYQEEGYPIVPSHDIMGNIETNNYDIAFSNGTLTVKKAELTIAVDDVKWRIGKERPDNSFSISPDQLKIGDTVEQITGGSVTYTNAVWTDEHPAPTYADKDKYENEIWIDLSRLSGTRAKNYDISVDPGTLEIASAEVKFEVALSGEENGLGVQELTLTITNKGDPIDTDYDYWVELMPGTNKTGKLVYCICKGMSVSSDWKFSPIRTPKMGDGSDYVNLTDEVTNALWTVVGNRDGVFGTGEVVTITGISFYHSDVSGKRHDIMSVLDGDASSFIKAGKLFNVADVNKDFVIDEEEKADAGWLLGKSVADYLEVTRLALLRYYHWDAKEGTWVGPSK